MLLLDHRKIQAVETIVKAAEEKIHAEVGLDVRLDVNGTPGSDVLTVETVIQTVCNVIRVSPIAVLGKRGQMHVTWARHIACWYLVSMCGMKPAAVADLINKDRTTVTNSVEATNNLLAAKDLQFTPVYQACITALTPLFKTSENEI